MPWQSWDFLLPFNMLFPQEDMTMKPFLIYDNGGGTIDRYTVFTEFHEGAYREALCLSDNCDAPNGFSQWTVGVPCHELGQIVNLADLPQNVQAHIKLRLAE